MDIKARNRPIIFPHRSWLATRQWLRAICLTTLSALLLVAPSQAATINGLYDGTVRIKDRSEATRSAAFNAALAIVLTKVSGRSDAVTRVGNAANSGERYVQRYSYLSTGQLEVGFDGAAINNLLEQAGLPLWDRDRPNTLLVYPQMLQGSREAVMATEQTARLRGVPIVWANGQTSEQFPAGSTQQIQDLARRYDAVAVLLARPGPGDNSAANLRWQLVFNGATEELLGAAEVGPNLAADVLSRYYAAVGKDAVRLFIEVSGVDNLNAYARTLAYLNGLLMVRSVSVESLQRDVLRLRVDLRGNQEALRRALVVDQKLVEATALAIDTTSTPANGSTPALSYRYNN
jgi:hypothetical protein